MGKTKIYVHYFGKRYFGDKRVAIKVQEVDVIETDQQYRTVDGSSGIMHQQKINKDHTEQVINDFGRYYWITRKPDMEEFKRRILKLIAQQSDELKEKLKKLEEKAQFVTDEFEREGVKSNE